MKKIIAFVALVSVASVAAAEPQLGADLATFQAKVLPFVKAHCVKCHGAETPEGKFTITALTGDIVKGEGLDHWIAVAAKLKAGEMPPDDEKQPDPAVIKVVTDWIDGELSKAGRSGVIQAGSLRTGNHVPHDLLFGAKVGQVPLDNPPRVWRVSPFIYEEFAKQFRGLQLAQPFSLPPGDRFKDQSAGGLLDESTTAQIMRNAETIADEQLGISGKKFGNKKAPKELAPLLTGEAKPEEIAAAVRHQFEFVLKRRPTADETVRFTELYRKALTAGGAESAARVLLVAVLLQPETSFRSELGLGGSGERKMLAPREVAFALAYALTDKAPGAELLKAADAGRLVTKADIEQQIVHTFADEKQNKSRVLRFFREYFGYGTAIEVFKDQKDFPGHDAKLLVEDTDLLVSLIVGQDKNVFEELLTTNLSFVAYRKADNELRKLEDSVKKYEELKRKDPKKAATKEPPDQPKKLHAASYNLKQYMPTADQPIRLPAAERAGILTQPAWLVAYSENFDNHAIRRGKWIRERLLGGTVPDLPINVDAQLPDAPHQTLRQRMEVTKQTYCWQCHQKMNAIGLTFEEFDHFGRHRAVQTVHEENAAPDPKTKQIATRDVPVDSTGLIDGTGDPTVDGRYGSSVEMIRKLAKTDRARQVFIRHAFRYWMGRDENLGDAKTLMAADAAYLKNGGSMKALITSLLTSDSFLVRTTLGPAQK